MSPGTIALIGILVLILLFLLRMPVAFVMGFVGFVGFSIMSSLDTALSILGKDFWANFSSYSLTVFLCLFLWVRLYPILGLPRGFIDLQMLFLESFLEV